MRNKTLATLLLASVALLFAPGAHAQSTQNCTATVTTNCTHNIVVSWSAPAGNPTTPPTSYNVKRSTTKGTETTVTTVDAATTPLQWVDLGKGGGAVPGQVYFYVITAVYPTAESSNSQEVTATFFLAPPPPPSTPPPSNVGATAF